MQYILILASLFNCMLHKNHGLMSRQDRRAYATLLVLESAVRNPHPEIVLKSFFIFRMKDESLVKACTRPSAGKEVVTSLMKGLIDLAVDKVVVKNGSGEKVARKANFVQRKSLEMKGKNETVSVSRERVERVKAASGSKTPTWVEDPNLPSGWKSCVAGDCSLGNCIARISRSS